MATPTPRGRALLEDFIAQLERGELPRDRTPEELAEIGHTLRALLELAPTEPPRRKRGRGRPRKVELSLAELDARSFLIQQIQTDPVRYGARERAMQAAVKRRFRGQRFNRLRLERILRKLVESSVTDWWTFGREELTEVSASDLWLL